MRGAVGRSACQAVAMRLHPGEDLRLRLQACLREVDADAAVMMTCVGSLRCADLRLADESLPGPVEGPFEIVSLLGTLGRGSGHLHIALADGAGRVMGGHVRPGCIVHTTAEVVLGLLPDLVFGRQFDPQTGFDELVVEVKKDVQQRRTEAIAGFRAGDSRADPGGTGDRVG